MPRIRAGELRSRLTLQQKTETSDGIGGTTKTWADVSPLFAKVVPADASGETSEAGQTVSRRRYTVTIRRRAGITSAMRLASTTQLLDILAVLPSDEFLDGMVLDCREAVFTPASGLLLRYAAGDVRAGVSVVRNLAATQYDVNGVLQTAAPNVLRDGHYIAGVRTQLVESARTNVLLQSRDLSSASWSKTVSSALRNAVGADGTPNTASTLTEDTTDSSVHAASSAAIALPDNVTPVAIQAIIAPNGRRYGVFYIANGLAGADRIGVNYDLTLGTAVPFVSGAGVVQSTRITALANGRYRIEVVGVRNGAPVSSSLNFRMASQLPIISYVGDGVSGIITDFAQIEFGASFCSTPIATTTAAVTRPADVVTIPGVNTGGQPATLYQKYFDLAASAWVEVAAPYASGASLPRVTDRAYALDKIALGTKTLAEMQAA